MKKFNKVSIVATLILSLVFVSAPSAKALVLPFTPSLGVADTFSILSDTFTSTVGPTTVTGDIGYTTGPAVPAVLTGTIHTAVSDIPAGGIYNQAGLDQATALAALNTQSCSFTFAPGAIDLATDVTHIPAFGSILGEYVPGVYCTSGVASAYSVGTAGITLVGSGTYVFRNDGALTTVTGSSVALTGASACDVFWTPNGGTTLAHDSTFTGTVIPILAAAHDITIMDTVTWIGRALTFGHTVTTPQTNVVITKPTCTTPSLTLNNIVVNDSGRSKPESSWILTATGATTLSGHGATGSTDVVSDGSFLGGTYTLSQSGPSMYTASAWTCTNGVTVNGSNQINLGSGQTTVCSITNNDTFLSSGGSGGGSSPSSVSSTTSSSTNIDSPVIGISKSPNPTSLPNGLGTVYYNYSVWNGSNGQLALTNVSVTDDKCNNVKYISGDTNLNNKLDKSENWVYQCKTTLYLTTTNIATATAYGDNTSHLLTSATATATVVVAGFVPKFPNTGYPAGSNGAQNALLILGGIVLGSSIVYSLKKKQNA